MSEIICKYCGGKTFFTKKKNTNTGLYCSGCGNWVKWLSKKDLQQFTQTGKVYEKPASFNNKSGSNVNMQVNLTSYIAHLEGLVTSLQNTVSYSEAENERNNEKVSIYLSTISALENIKDGKQWYDK